MNFLLNHFYGVNSCKYRLESAVHIAFQLILFMVKCSTVRLYLEVLWGNRNL